MLSSPLRMSVISPSSAPNPKENGPSSAMTNHSVGMSSSLPSPIATGGHSQTHSASMSSLSSSSSSSHETKSKVISNKLASLETDINQYESKIARLMKKREERTRHASANSSQQQQFINHNNNINKATLIQMGAGVLPPNHLNSIKSSPSDEVKTENSQSLTEVKLSQSLPLSQDKYESVTITDASSRLLQLPTVEHDTVQLSCTCFAHTAEGEGCTRKASCTRTENVRDLAETNKKLTEQDFIFKIYSQNRKNADFWHRMLGDSGPCLAEIPKYAQPCEAPAYQANRNKFHLFKSKLVESISRQKKTLHEADQNWAEQYDSSYTQWSSKVQSQKNSAKRRAKDAKNREFFEKIFPDLKKRREQDERIARMGTRGSGKSEFEIEEIASSLRQQELSESEMHRNAVVPPLCVNRLGTNRSRLLFKYLDCNRFVEDPLSLHKHTQNISSWSPQQQKLFRDKYLVHPKNFAAISNSVGKPIEECVKFYYLKKPTENYKKQLRSNSIKRKRDPKIKSKTGSQFAPQSSETARSISPIFASASSHSSATAPPSTTTSTSDLSTSATATTSSPAVAAVAAADDSKTLPGKASSSTNSEDSSSTFAADVKSSTQGTTTCYSTDSSAATSKTAILATNDSTSNVEITATSSYSSSLAKAQIMSEIDSKTLPSVESGKTSTQLNIVSEPKVHANDKENQQQMAASNPLLQNMTWSSGGIGGSREDVFTRVVNYAQMDLARNSIGFTSVGTSNQSSTSTHSYSLASAKQEEANSSSFFSQHMSTGVAGPIEQLSRAAAAHEDSKISHVSTGSISNYPNLISGTATTGGALPNRAPSSPIISHLSGGSVGHSYRDQQLHLQSSSGTSGGHYLNVLSRTSNSVSPRLQQVGIKAEFDRSSIQSISPGASAILQLHQQQQNQQQQQQLFGENRTHYQLPEVNSPPNRERTSLKNCCPVPLCTHNKNRHRKLKCLHTKFDSLSHEQRQALQTELGITEGVTKACAHCYNRITQLLDPEHVIGSSSSQESHQQSNSYQHQHPQSGSTSVSPNSSAKGAAQAFSAEEAAASGSVAWTSEEEERYRSVLKNHGLDWERLGAAIPSKTDRQLRHFYLENSHKLHHLVSEWTKTTVASRRNRIGSSSNATRGSHSASGRNGTGSTVESGGATNHQAGSDDTDYLTDDADDPQQLSSANTTTATEGGGNSPAQMKSHIMRKYTLADGSPVAAVPNNNNIGIVSSSVSTQPVFSKAFANNSAASNSVGDNSKQLTIDDIISKGINSKVSPEDMDLTGTPILKLFSDLNPNYNVKHNHNLFQRHVPSDCQQLQMHSQRNLGGSSSPPAALKGGCIGGQKQTALDMMKSQIRSNLANGEAIEGPISKQLRIDLQHSGTNLSAISPSSGGSTRNPLDKTSPISPTPLNSHSRPSSKGTSNAPPAPPPLLHIPSQLSAAAAAAAHHDRKSPLVNKQEKMQQLVNNYTNNTAVTLGGSISQGIPVPYPSLMSEMTPEQQVLAVAARQLHSSTGMMQLNGLNGSNPLLITNDLLRLRRERAGALDIPSTTTSGIGASIKSVTNELLATDYMTSQNMDAAHKNKHRTSPPNGALSSNAPPPSSTSMNVSGRRAESIQAAQNAATQNANGALAVAAALQNLPNLPPQALLDPQLSAYILQNQQIQQQLQQLYLPHQNANKQLFVPQAPSNHPINWPLLSSVGVGGAAPPWPYPGTVPGAPPPPTTSSSLRPPTGSHAPAFQHLAAAVSQASFTNGSVSAADYARHLELSDPMILQKLAEYQHLDQLLKLHPGFAGKEHQLTADVLYNLHSSVGGNSGNSAAAQAAAQEANRLAQHQSVNYFKANPAVVASKANAMAANEREKSKVLLQQSLIQAGHSNATAAAVANSYLNKRSVNEMQGTTPLTLPSSMNSGNKMHESRQPSSVFSSSLQRVPPATTGAAVSSAPPVNKVPKLSPSEVREHQRAIEEHNHSLEQMHRKRAISPSSGKGYGASMAKKMMSQSEHQGGMDANVPRSTNSNSRLQYNSSTTSSGANSNMTHPSQNPSIVVSSNNQGLANGPSSQSTLSGAHASANGTSDNGKGGGGGNSNSNSNYQMQKHFSDKYVPKYYRPSPMLKQSSKKDEHQNGSNGAQIMGANSTSSGAVNVKKQPQLPSVSKENGCYTQSKDNSKENKDTNQQPAVNTKHHNVSRSSPVSVPSSSATTAAHPKPLVHEVSKS